MARPSESDIGNDDTRPSSPHDAWIAAARAEAAARGPSNAEPTRGGTTPAGASPAAGSAETDRGLTAIRAQLGDRYEISGAFQRGGQGVVYRGLQRGTRREVAVKVLHEGAAADPVGRARFEREAQILGQLRHPNIVTVHESGGSANSLFLVMDFIRGAALDEYLREHKPEPRRIAELFADICEAVNAAHLRGVIHRDLKPSNVRVDASGRPHVLDFGLAKPTTPGEAGGFDSTVHTETGQFLGSVSWASPEQVSGRHDELDVRTDVYSIGVMLYHALTGYFPYPVTGPIRQVLENICHHEPPAPAVAGAGVDLPQIVLKCLRKPREERYQSAGDLERDLRRMLAGEPIEARRDQMWYRLRTHAARYRSIAIVSSLLLFMGLSSLAVLIHSYRKETELRSEAESAGKAADAARQRAEAALAEEAIQRGIAATRAKETDAIAGFQATLLSNIDAEAMGKTIVEEIRRHATARTQTDANRVAGGAGSVAGTAADAEPARMEQWTEGLQPADIARRVLATHVLGGAAESAESRFADQPRVVAELLTTLGSSLMNLGLAAEAEAPLRRALDLVRATQSRAPSVDWAASEAKTLSYLGGVLTALGRSEEADEMHSAALALANQSGAFDDSTRVRILGNVARVRSDRRDDRGALEYSTLAVETARRLPEKHSEELVMSLGNLGTLRARMGDLTGAESLLREAMEHLQLDRAAPPEQTTYIFTNLGTVLLGLGKPEQAEPLLRRAVDITAARLGEGHPEYAYALESLARVNRDRDPIAARTMLEKSLSIYRKVFGNRHRSTAQVCDLLGTTLRMTGDYAEAEKLLRESLATTIELSPDTPRDIARLHNNLARTLLSAKKHAEAVSHLREAIAIYERESVSETDEGRLATTVNLARGLTYMSQLSDARGLLERVNAVIEQRLPPTSPLRKTLAHAWTELLAAEEALETGTTADAAKKD